MGHECLKDGKIDDGYILLLRGIRYRQLMNGMMDVTASVALDIVPKTKDYSAKDQAYLVFKEVFKP
jgi:hypothetical protein